MASGMQKVFPKWMKKLGSIARWGVLSVAVAGASTLAMARQDGTGVTASGSANKTADHSASKTILVLGDSLSAEYGLARGAGWVPLLAQRLKTRNIDARIENASISGETTSGGKARLTALLQQHRPGIVIIELGGNDGLRGLPMSATADNLRDMIDVAKQSGARVLLLGMQIPPNYGASYTRQFAQLYPQVAKETGASLVPFFLEGLQTRIDLFQPDRIHPSAAAQPMMLENVWPMLQPMLAVKADAAAAPTQSRSAPIR